MSEYFETEMPEEEKLPSDKPQPSAVAGESDDQDFNDAIVQDDRDPAMNVRPLAALEIEHIIEGALLASNQPLNIDKLHSLFDEGELESKQVIGEALQRIAASINGRGYELREVGSGWRFQVKKESARWVNRLFEERPQRYSRALLETLALIAYRQPITRGDIEEIRGVAVSSHIMKTLLEREWVKVVGQRDVPGRPSLYATTRKFLDYFNLRSLDELPSLGEISDLEDLNPQLDLDGNEIQDSDINVDQEAAETISEPEPANQEVELVPDEEPLAVVEDREVSGVDDSDDEPGEVAEEPDIFSELSDDFDIEPDGFDPEADGSDELTAYAVEVDADEVSEAPEPEVEEDPVRDEKKPDESTKSSNRYNDLNSLFNE